VASLEIAEVAEQVVEMKVFEGAGSGLLGGEDFAAAGEALEPGTSAALLVYENSWAGPFAAAVRRSGGQLVANGRIPVQALLAALDEAEAAGWCTSDACTSGPPQDVSPEMTGPDHHHAASSVVRMALLFGLPASLPGGAWPASFPGERSEKGH